MIVAHERGLLDRFECVRTVAVMTDPNPALLRNNPLNKIPTLVFDDGSTLFDSPVICEYLDSLDGKPLLFPIERARRFTALRRQALGDGYLDMLLLWRNERERPAERRYEPLLSAFKVKSDMTLALLEREAATLDDGFDIGHIAIGTALGYLDFRFPDLEWRRSAPRLAAWHERFASRPSVAATEPTDDKR
jgi:glutathione S-transferase